MRDAWGSVRVHAIATAMPNNYVFVSDLAATSDGQYLIGSLEPRDFSDNTTRPSYLVLDNIATGALTTIRQLPNPQDQILAVGSDGDWIVWSEAADQPNFFDWTLFAYNRRSGMSTQLAAAIHQNGQAIAGPYPTPSVSHDKVIWAEATGPITTDNYDNAVVQLTDLPTRQTTTVAPRASAPSMSWPWAAWAQESSGSNGYVALKNLATGQTLQLPQQPVTVTLSGTSAAYDDVHSVNLLDDFTRDTAHPLLLVQVSDPNHLQFVTLNDRIVAFQSDTTAWVYDRLERRLVVLPVAAQEITAFVSGRLLVWWGQAPAGQEPTLQVVDTTTLPATPAG